MRKLLVTWLLAAWVWLTGRPAARRTLTWSQDPADDEILGAIRTVPCHFSDTGARRGLDNYTYYNSGSYGSPTWGLIPTQDEELGLKRTKITSSVRAFNNIKTDVAGLIEISPKFTMVYDQSIVSLVVIQAAFWATTLVGNSLEFAFSDGPIAGSGIRYIRAVCGVFDITEPHPLDGLDVVNVEVGPTYNANPPTVNTA